MKKNSFIFLTILSFFFVHETQAQWSFTPQIGINRSKTDYSNSKFDNTFAFLSTPVLGLTTQYKFSKKWATELGIQYSSRGNKLKDLKDAMKVQYFDFLPTIVFSTNSFFSFYSGLNIGISKGSFFRTNDVWRKSEFVTSANSKVDIGALLGIRFKIEDITLGVHYNHSLLPFGQTYFTDDAGDVEYVSKEYHQLFQLTLGYQINLKNK